MAEFSKKQRILGLTQGPNPSAAMAAALAAAAQQQQVQQPQGVAAAGQQQQPAVTAASGVPTSAGAAQLAAQAAVGNPYAGYNLANIDMSSLQGVDWSSIYGMGLYV